MNNYPGGKNGAGTWQQIINQQPPHRRYIEPFLGSGAVMRRKRPAQVNIGVDLERECCQAFGDSNESVALFGYAAPDAPQLILLAQDAFAFLRDRYEVRERDTLVYLDPPYLVNKNGLERRPIYRRELNTVEGHATLLDLIVALPCMVQISGYWSELYADRLRGWRAIQFTGQTRGGPATEWLWMNYPEPTALHDYRFFGADRRKRLDFKRMVTRWQKRLEQMPPIQRHAMTEALRIQAAEMPPVTGKQGDHQTVELPSVPGAEDLQRRALEYWRSGGADPDRVAVDVPSPPSVLEQDYEPDPIRRRALAIINARKADRDRQTARKKARKADRATADAPLVERR